MMYILYRDKIFKSSYVFFFYILYRDEIFKSSYMFLNSSLDFLWILDNDELYVLINSIMVGFDTRLSFILYQAIIKMLDYS